MLHGNPLRGCPAAIRTGLSLSREGVVAVTTETPGVGCAAGRDVVKEQLKALGKDAAASLRCVDR
jgi:hypothetical protein